MARLRKAAAAELLDRYDEDPVGALTVALRLVLEQPAARWEDLVAALPAGQRTGLLTRDPQALDALAAELNELRTVASAAPPPSSG